MKINLLKLTKAVLKDKRNMAIYCTAGAVIGTIVAFSIPKFYKSHVMLAPESSSNSLSSSISSLASMVGMDMQMGNGMDAIYPEIYPDLMESTDFLVELFPIQVTSNDGNIHTSYYDYMLHDQKIVWWAYPSKWLSDFIKSLSADEGQHNNGEVDPFRLTKEQFGVAKSISENIMCSVDKKTSVITIEVTDQDPLIAATMADSLKSKLQVFITDYRTNKARNDLAYMESLYKEAKEQYTKARQQYAAFADANQDVILQSYISKRDDLENEMQLKYNIYTQVVQQLQMAKAKVQERTPAFTVVQAAFVPVKHSNKPKVMTMMAFVVLALAVRLSIIMFKNNFFATDTEQTAAEETPDTAATTTTNSAPTTE